MSEKSQASVAALPAAAPPTAHFEVPAPRLLQDWKAAYERALLYLEALGVPPGERDAVANAAIDHALHHEPWGADSDAIVETLRALRAYLPERYPMAPRSGVPQSDEFLAWRLNAQLSGRFSSGAGGAPAAAVAPPDGAAATGGGSGGFSAMPTLTRRAMVPEKIERRMTRRLLGRLLGWSRREYAWIHFEGNSK